MNQADVMKEMLTKHMEYLINKGAAHKFSDLMKLDMIDLRDALHYDIPFHRRLYQKMSDFQKNWIGHGCRKICLRNCMATDLFHVYRKAVLESTDTDFFTSMSKK